MYCHLTKTSSSILPVYVSEKHKLHSQYWIVAKLQYYLLNDKEKLFNVIILFMCF